VLSLSYVTELEGDAGTQSNVVKNLLSLPLRDFSYA
jgi:hypothetical protein